MALLSHILQISDLDYPLQLAVWHVDDETVLFNHPVGVSDHYRRNLSRHSYGRLVSFLRDKPAFPQLFIATFPLPLPRHFLACNFRRTAYTFGIMATPPASIGRRPLESGNMENERSSTALGMTSPIAKLGIVGLGASPAPLDIAVNVALPAITDHFALALSDVQWLVVCYVLVYGSLMLVCGKMGDLVGHRLIFRTGLVVTAVGCVACAICAFGWPALSSTTETPDIVKPATTMAEASSRSFR